MKQIFLFTILTLATDLSLSAQGTSTVAKEYATDSKKVAIRQSNADEPAVREIITTLETGWNSKSGATFASVFADVHDYIVVNGMYFSNFTKLANETTHQGLFNGVYKNFNIKLKVDEVTFLRADLAQIIVIGGGHEKGGNLPENPGIIMTILAEKKNDIWKIISFHNHEFNAAELKQRSPVPLTAMYKTWYTN